MLDLQLKIISREKESPLRFGLLEGGALLASFSLEVMKEFFPQNFLTLGEEVVVSLEEETLQKLQEKEKRQLQIAMATYLAKRETSPRKLKNWLEKRYLAEDLQTELIEEATRDLFLSPIRYLEGRVTQHFRAGKKPWRVVAAEIRREVLLGNEEDSVKERIQSHLEALAYDDCDLLLNNQILRREFLEKFSGSREGEERFVRRMTGRGFYPVVVYKFIQACQQE